MSQSAKRTRAKTKPVAPTPPSPPPSVAELLSPQALARLRAAYKAEVMIRASGRTLTRLFPKSEQYIEAVLAEYQGDDDLAAKDRERCIIAILTTQRSALTLAAHLYWGLMVGLEPVEIANTLLLTGAYSGVPNFTIAMFTFRDLLKELSALAALGGEHVTSENVLTTLLTRFD